MFSKPFISQDSEYFPAQKLSHLLITKETVGQALSCQAVKKAPGSNTHNFSHITHSIDLKSRYYYVSYSTSLTIAISSSVMEKYKGSLNKKA